MTDYVISVAMTFDNPDSATDDNFERFINAAVTAFGEINDGDLVASASWPWFAVRDQTVREFAPA